ncbi:MAG: hypothetical protein AAF438_21335 [Pseudomonadota bacterium]
MKIEKELGKARLSIRTDVRAGFTLHELWRDFEARVNDINASVGEAARTTQATIRNAIVPE